MAEPGRGRRAAGGFLLIEAVVALAILAVAFGYGFRSLADAFDRFGRDQATAAALALAQSTLDRVGADLSLGAGESSGRTPDGFVWSVATAPYAAVVPSADSGLAGYVVRVTVAWKDGGLVRQVLLSTVRLSRGGAT